MTVSPKKWSVTMDKALNYLSLARKAGLCELGEEPVGAITRTGKGYAILVAADASDHTWRRAKSFAAGTEQQCIRLPYSKEEMGFVVGRTSLAIAAVTDPALALALVQSLPADPRLEAPIAVLTQKAQRAKKRQAEAKAHKRNVRMGKTKK